jgi:hypothetical protein
MLVWFTDTDVAGVMGVVLACVEFIVDAEFYSPEIVGARY